jgi:hypothetical protein
VATDIHLDQIVQSPVQLRLVNQHKIVPIGRLTGVPMNIYMTCVSMEDSKVIEIVYDTQLYPALMGLEWVFNNHAIINFKKREMIFKVEDLKVTAHLDPLEGKRYIEPVRGKDIENLYNLSVWMEDFVDPTTDGTLSCRSINSCASYSKANLENWQQRMHEVSTRRCA